MARSQRRIRGIDYWGRVLMRLFPIGWRVCTSVESLAAQLGTLAIMINCGFEHSRACTSCYSNKEVIDPSVNNKAGSLRFQYNMVLALPRGWKHLAGIQHPRH